MKSNLKLYFMLVLCSSINLALGQVTLDTIVPITVGYSYDFKTVQISSTETKYFRVDTVANTFNLYNMDWSPFISNVLVPEPFYNASHAYQAIYITRTLFDCDSSNIEYLYTAPSGGAGRNMYVMRTDGTELFYLDSAYSPYCFGGCLGGSDAVSPIKNTSSGAKLFVYRTHQPWTGDLHIYDLCGSLPADIFDFSGVETSFINLFPNPTNNSITFEMNLPNNVTDFELSILDNAGTEIERKRIDAGSSRLTYDINVLSSGLYFYSLRTQEQLYQTGKFIVTK
jgi:hypothetical protein